MSEFLDLICFHPQFRMSNITQSQNTEIKLIGTMNNSIELNCFDSHLNYTNGNKNEDMLTSSDNKIEHSQNSQAYYAESDGESNTPNREKSAQISKYQKQIMQQSYIHLCVLFHFFLWFVIFLTSLKNKLWFCRKIAWIKKLGWTISPQMWALQSTPGIIKCDIVFLHY